MGYQNRLSGFQNNSKQIFCSVLDSSSNQMNLAGYIPTFYLKSVVIDSPLVLEKVGTILDASQGAISFNLTPEDCSLIAQDYIYEIIIDNSTNRISVVQDKFSILDSIKY